LVFIHPLKALPIGGDSMMRKLIFLLALHFSLYGSAIPNFENMSQCENVTFFLSTTRSGSNLVSASLGIITRKPIAWIKWGMQVFDPSSPYRNHPSYNRLGLSLISDTPLLYRSHLADDLSQVPSHLNKLIFVTRNPKELLFRDFYLKASSDVPSTEFIQQFLDAYLKNFDLYDSWLAENRYLIFYEDFIYQDDQLLIQLLQFMGEEPTYFEDFLSHKEEYLARLLDSYKTQHSTNKGGASSKDARKLLYYSESVPIHILTYIDDYLKSAAPTIWERYLKRFQSVCNQAEME
jgi:hypothetical protein